MLNTALWISKLSMLRGLSYVKTVNGEIVEVRQNLLEPDVRIVVSMGGVRNIRKLYGEVLDDPYGLYKVLSEGGMRLEIRGKHYMAYFTNREGLGDTIKDILAKVGSAEEIVVTQPDNVGLRIYRS